MFQKMFRCNVLIDLVKILIHRLFALPQFTADLHRFMEPDFMIRGICGSFSCHLQNVFNPANGDEHPAWPIV